MVADGWAEEWVVLRNGWMGGVVLRNGWVGGWVGEFMAQGGNKGVEFARGEREKVRGEYRV